MVFGGRATSGQFAMPFGKANGKYAEYLDVLANGSSHKWLAGFPGNIAAGLSIDGSALKALKARLSKLLPAEHLALVDGIDSLSLVFRFPESGVIPEGLVLIESAQAKLLLGILESFATTMDDAEVAGRKMKRVLLENKYNAYLHAEQDKLLVSIGTSLMEDFLSPEEENPRLNQVLSDKSSGMLRELEPTLVVFMDYERYRRFIKNYLSKVIKGQPEASLEDINYFGVLTAGIKNASGVLRADYTFELKE